MTDLEEIIRQEISAAGPIPFSRFMELALYHPALGYYRQTRDPFGIHGDFFTAEQFPVFGQMLAIYTRHLSLALDTDASFEILELGSGREELSKSLHEWNYRGFDWKHGRLPEAMSGLVIANEFFDALPVHLLRRTSTGWRELSVNWDREQFTFVEAEKLSAELAAHAGQYGSSVPSGGLLEVNLEAAGWLQRTGGLLRKGRMLVIDYGYSTAELARFPAGTLMAYRWHVAHTGVLNGPGTQDITAHVNFSQLREDAVNSGFGVVSECSLQSWALSICETAEWIAFWESAGMKARLQWKQLVFGMGEIFRVLELEKAGTK